MGEEDEPLKRCWDDIHFGHFPGEDFLLQYKAQDDFCIFTIRKSDFSNNLK